MGIKSNLSAGSIIPALATLAIALMTGSAGNLAAQTNKPAGATNAAPVEKGNRFLLIVDTSASMKPSAGDVVRAVDEILLSGASSQLRPGDTLGVWTFNEQLHPGVMPLQTWRPEDKELVARRTREFLKKQHYWKQSQFAAALQGMYAVVNSSDIITVVLIS